MKKTPKILLICTLCCVLFSALCTTAFAQAINGDLSSVSSSNLMMTPRRTAYLQKEKLDQGYYGTVFHSNPIYKPQLAEDQSQYIYVNGSRQGDFTGASYMTHLTQRIQYFYSGGYNYRYVAYLTKAADASNPHVYIGQFDYENIRIRHGVDANSWIYYARNHASTNVSLYVKFLTYNDGEGWAEGEASTVIDFTHTDRFNIRDVYDLCVSNGAFTGDDRGILVRQMTITNETYDGSLYTIQDAESIGGSILQQLQSELITHSPIGDAPALLEWLSVAVGGFFDTTIFAIGNVNIKIGTLFLIPLSCWIVVLFVKKFAGG